MSDLIIRRALVVDPGGPHNGEELDILVRDGLIARTGQRLQKGGAREIRVEGLHVSPGWIDLRVHFRDPGEEWKCGIANGLDAAAAGGFTHACVLPSTQPAIDGRAGIGYLLRKAEGHPVRLMPLGAITQACEGKQLAEMADMRAAGAVAFSDDQHPIMNSRLMALALRYSAGLPGDPPPIMTFAQDRGLLANGLMHEGLMSTSLGLRAIPAEAEAIQLARDIALAEYAGGRLHAATISTAQAVELVRQAKARKSQVTASVAAHHLLLDDRCLSGYDSSFKVMPPLRDESHIQALRLGLKDGTIDAIVSDHRPEDPEHKRVELGRAAFGAVGLETAFAAANTALKGSVPLRRLIERFTTGPRAVLGLPTAHIADAGPACMTLFHPGVEWKFSESDLVSRSRNTPFIGTRFTGRPLGIVSQGRLMLAPGYSALVGA
ncbi:MAG: dihydroorotase [Flavobacteriales bacterium]|nr:dihydroorotase [Flavobacteriales bacterium]